MNLTAPTPNLSGHQGGQTVCSGALQGFFRGLGALLLGGTTFGGFASAGNTPSRTPVPKQANAPADVSIEKEGATLC